LLLCGIKLCQQYGRIFRLEIGKQDGGLTKSRHR